MAHQSIEREFRDRLTDKAPIHLSRRFSVYRNNLFVSLVEALMARYPAVRAAVGVEFFTAMARDFAADHLPVTPVMTHYGESFPDYLESFEPLSDYPWIADLARVERAITHVFHAADEYGLTPQDLTGIQIDEIGSLQFRLIDAQKMISSQFPIVTLWHMNMGQIEPASIAAIPAEAAFVYRSDLTVHVTPLTSAEADFIDALNHKVCVANAFERARETDQNFNLSAVLNMLIRDRLIKTIYRSETRNEHHDAD